jgi:hypothetical protein
MKMLVSIRKKREGENSVDTISVVFFWVILNNANFNKYFMGQRIYNLSLDYKCKILGNS